MRSVSVYKLQTTRPLCPCQAVVVGCDLRAFTCSSVSTWPSCAIRFRRLPYALHTLNINNNNNSTGELLLVYFFPNKLLFYLYLFYIHLLCTLSRLNNSFTNKNNKDKIINLCSMEHSFYLIQSAMNNLLRYIIHFVHYSRLDSIANISKPI